MAFKVLRPKTGWKLWVDPRFAPPTQDHWRIARSAYDAMKLMNLMGIPNHVSFNISMSGPEIGNCEMIANEMLMLHDTFEGIAFPSGFTMELRGVAGDNPMPILHLLIAYISNASDYQHIYFDGLRREREEAIRAAQGQVMPTSFADMPLSNALVYGDAAQQRVDRSVVAKLPVLMLEPEWRLDMALGREKRPFGTIHEDEPPFMLAPEFRC